MSYHADIERRARERVGTTLRAKYHLDSLLGLGGMAAVYAATHKNRNRVAVKMLHAELAINAEMRARFLREGYVANTVDHPGAVRILDDDVLEDGSVYLVMELLEGESFETRLDRFGGKLPPIDVATIAVEVCDVLATAHSKKIVHRDIKPDNTFITKQGQVKILDFGIARLRDGENAQSSTQTGQTVGTPAFMSPEQALGDTERIGPATDVWSVGATMFIALTGRFVHLAKTQQEMLVFAASRQAPPLDTVATGIPTEICAVVDKALAFDPANRFADGADMRDALRAAIAKLSPSGHRVSLVDVGEGPSLRTDPSVGKTAFDATQILGSDAGAAPVWERSEVNTTAGVSSGRMRVAATRRRQRLTIGLAAGALAIVGVLIVAFRAREPKIEALPSPAPKDAAASPAVSIAPAVLVPVTASTIVAPPAKPSLTPSNAAPTVHVPTTAGTKPTHPASSIDPLDHQ